MHPASTAARDATAEEQEQMLYPKGSPVPPEDEQNPAKTSASTGDHHDHHKDDDKDVDRHEPVKFPPWMIIVTWISLSTAVIFYNRDIMVGHKQFRYPITLTTLHLLFQTVATRILHRLTDLISGTNTSKLASLSANGTGAGGAAKYTALPMTSMDDRQQSHASAPTLTNSGPGTNPGFSQDDDKRRIKDASVYMTWDDWRLQILPPAVMFSASLVLSNWAYLYLSTAYIQMLKAFGPVAYLLAAFALGTKVFSLKLLGIVCVISSGVGMASYGEANFNLTGFLIQATAIAIEATRVTLIQILLQSGGDMSPLKTLYFFAPVCFCVNAALIIPFEGFGALLAIPQLGFLTILSNCSLTFLLNLSGVYLISLSSMVLSLTKVVKDILLVAGSALILGDTLTLFQCFAYGVSTVGLFWYKTSS
ncbi:hypothetical protein ACM66B_005723 [Microbotryomycetes sp. NB124-2]